MAVATTFGTASTGTAISTLSGAAATKAALAWLGGGALTAGGGGMAAGSALLTLAGPIGWTIGGATILGTGLFQRGKNKKIATEALAKTAEIKADIKILEGSILEIEEVFSLTKEHIKGLNVMTRELHTILDLLNYDFERIEDDNELIHKLGSLVNNANSAAELLNRSIGGE